MKSKKDRFSKDKFLQDALDVLSIEGSAGLRIESLCKELGVSRGSFYWHFKNRDDFELSLLEFWKAEYTESIGRHIQKLDCPADEKLYFLAETLIKANLAKYDLALRSWAAQNEKVARIVREVDRIRIKILTEVFSQMGFKGRELDVRVRTFVYFYSLENAFFYRESKKERLAAIPVRLKLLTQK